MTSQTCVVEELTYPKQETASPAISREGQRDWKVGLSIIAVLVIAVALAAWLSRPKTETLASVVEYRPAVGSFAATAPLVPGYNMPASMSAELWGVIKGRDGFNVYEGQSRAIASEASAVLYRPAEGSFAATAPLIRGYNMPASISAELWGVIKGRDGFNIYEGQTPALASEASGALHRPAEGSFAATTPLIPGYSIPHHISLELWEVITGREGFNVYEGQ